MKRTVFILLLLITAISSEAQRGSGFSYGIEGSALLNSATLPDIKINTDINDIISGAEIVKGKANYADFTFNYRVGGFMKYDHGFGFALVEINYTTTKIYKEIKYLSENFLRTKSILPSTLERDYSYLDIALSYNVYLSDKFFFGIGITPAFILSHTGKQDPNTIDWRAFAGPGFNISNKISVSTRLELGLTEVYTDTYIHHIMIPVTLQIAL